MKLTVRYYGFTVEVAGWQFNALSPKRLRRFSQRPEELAKSRIAHEDFMAKLMADDAEHYLKLRSILEET